MVQFSDDVRDMYAKKTADEIATEGKLSTIFSRGRHYELLEGHLFLGFSADDGN